MNRVRTRTGVLSPPLIAFAPSWLEVLISRRAGCASALVGVPEIGVFLSARTHFGTHLPGTAKWPPVECVRFPRGYRLFRGIGARI